MTAKKRTVGVFSVFSFGPKGYSVRHTDPPYQSVRQKTFIFAHRRYTITRVVNSEAEANRVLRTVYGGVGVIKKLKDGRWALSAMDSRPR